jgi:hypothetical protein
MKRGGPLRRTAALARMSAKRKAERARRTAVNAAVRDAAGGRCQIGAPGCAGAGQAAHEVYSRGRYPGSHVDDTPKLWACHPCNEYVTSHSAEAEARGWLVPSGLPRGGVS